MIEKFLKAKHWQLFLLTFGIPFILQITTIVSLFRNLVYDSNDDTIYELFFPIFMVITVMYAASLFGWYYSVAVGLQTKVPAVTMKIKKFKLFFFTPLVYFLIIITYISLISTADDAMHAVFILIIFPLHFFSLFCMFYTIYFVAKTIKTVELQREVRFSDFAGEFFMVWFFPIGVWILQPKINKSMERKEGKEEKKSFIQRY
ncbi:hypothetical protein NBRC110019_15050 [Neptunitalea chrysea]|uniref:Uncharacterized protein n=1 Tax=Neptunitalea chrysea TaxID=1647581 RepID=A0A9W6B4M9_9FLAO|nr:hypothetical protein [Neptunitalea chrysea]GLB52465.1 hypothetical protein NBRC110019_15050 [Neptunitalea chrysea]